MLFSHKWRKKGTDPKLWAVGNLLSLLPIFTGEVKKADLFEGCTFLVEVEGGDRGEQVVLPLAFCKDLPGEKLFRDSRRMRSQNQPHSTPKCLMTCPKLTSPWTLICVCFKVPDPDCSLSLERSVLFRFPKHEQKPSNYVAWAHSSMALKHGACLLRVSVLAQSAGFTTPIAVALNQISKSSQQHRVFRSRECGGE